jgi:SAM-dependent methyltransferase
MVKSKNTKSNTFSMITYLFFIVLLVQILVTYLYTNTKRFSIRALIRNTTFVIFIYLFIKTNKIFYLLLPFLIEIILEMFKYYGYYIDKYVATEYLYSDFFSEVVKNNNIYSNFSEGLYHNYFGINTEDNSPENSIKLRKWTEEFYENAYKNKTPVIKDLNGKIHENPYEIKRMGEINKFKRICEICKVHKDMKVLEIGFGECDFMNYLKENYGIKPVGVSISEEQVKLAKSLGYEAHHLDMWKITEDLGKFDLVLQCGNVEYLKCAYESNNLYEKYFKIINSILNKNGKYFITCLHFNYDSYHKFGNLYDYAMCYILLVGNDGCYPTTKYMLSEKAERVGLKTIFREEHTNDYFLE